MRQETCGTIVEYHEDLTATEATKAEGGALDTFDGSVATLESNARWCDN